MSSKIISAALIGIEAAPIEIEASLGGGDFGQIVIVGLPDTSVAEAKERVKSAIINSGWEFPKRKITVNLAPAELKKVGPAYDLPIALSIISLKYKIKYDFSSALFIGELSLSGEVRPIRGVVSITLAAKSLGLKKLFLPRENLTEAELVTGLEIIPVKTLRETMEVLVGKHSLSINKKTECKFNNTQLLNSFNFFKKPSVPILENTENNFIDLSDIKGQAPAKRALAVALAGGHNLLFSGPPGSGKTSLAQAAAGLLPPLFLKEKLELHQIYSLLPEYKFTSFSRRPFRSPHHQASVAALIGGGRFFRPGEMTLAHCGILFLDELPEFSRPALESLRQPLESGKIFISRAGLSLTLPANFILLAAMNPCPCGFKGSRQKECFCSQEKIDNYRRKISGPLLDRFDIQIEVSNLNYQGLNSSQRAESSAQVRKKIIDARARQKNRFPGRCLSGLNASLSSQEVEQVCCLNKGCQNLLKAASNKLILSNRAYFKILKISRSIADFDDSEQIEPEHVAEAIRYRLR